jgi:surface polysaccharide O-acyltransferase-like enzyme
MKGIESVDLFRVIAMFAVISLHTPLSILITGTFVYLASVISQFSRFAVFMKN